MSQKRVILLVSIFILAIFLPIAASVDMPVNGMRDLTLIALLAAMIIPLTLLYGVSNDEWHQEAERRYHFFKKHFQIEEEDARIIEEFIGSTTVMPLHELEE